MKRLPEKIDLDMWYDTRRAITDDNRRSVENQLGLYALKDHATNAQLNDLVASMRISVRRHNRQIGRSEDR